MASGDLASELDHVAVVGAASGCVVANRLSAERRHGELLPEAGSQDGDGWLHNPTGYAREFGKPDFDRINEIRLEARLNDSATAQRWTCFTSLTRHGLDLAGRYIDTFARDGERWLIAARRIAVEWYASPFRCDQVRLGAPGRKD